MKPLAPDLFQRRFQDLVEIGHARIPALAPKWTDHNANDPGIMLMELLAWVAEAQLYSLSRQRRDERAAYAELLGVAQSGTRAAHGLIWSDSLDPNSPALKFDHSVVIKDDAVINVLSVDTPTFRPTHKLLWVPGQISKLEAHLADGSVIDLTATNQRGGVAFFPLGDSAGPQDRLRLTFEARGKSGLFGPNRKDAEGALWAIGVRSATTVGAPTDFVRAAERSCHSPIAATLLLDDQRVPLEIKYDSTSGLLETGVLLLSLEKVPESPQECTIELRAPHGLPRPPQLLRLEPSVIPIEQGRPISEELQIENPMPDWSFKLTEPGLKFKPGKPPVQIEVQEAGRVYSWDLRKDLSEFGPDERVYELNITTGEITFGNGVNGKIPGVGSRLFVSYAVCDGAEGNIARDRQWTVSGFAGAFGVNVDPVTGGAAAPGLPDQRREARLRSRDEHGLITSEDIVNAAKALPLLDVARAWVVPPEKNHPRTGTVTLVAMRSRPASGEPEEVPETRRWLDAIREQLRPRMPLGTRLAVVAPNYVQFSVSATLQAEPGRDPTEVKQQVEKTLRSRVALVDVGDGTPPRQPGVPVTPRDVAAWMRLVDGVSRVTDLRLVNSAGQKVKEVAVSKSGLPRYAGSTITVTRSGQGGAA